MDTVTIETYNRAAEDYACKFSGIGPRVDDIERAFACFGKANPRVLELGCGDGRDALEICQRTDRYVGIDVSSAMISLAKEKVPQADFRVSDITDYTFDLPIDIIFAFASLLHIDIDSFTKVLEEAREALSVGGIFYISLKEGEYKGGEVVTDEYGERTGRTTYSTWGQRRRRSRRQ